MLKGFLQFKYGLNAADKRIATAMKDVAPNQHLLRQQGMQNQVNPQRYHAPYFGYNLHMDQNEKVLFPMFRTLCYTIN